MGIKIIDYDYNGVGALGNLTTNSNSSFNRAPIGIDGILTDIYLKQSTTAPVAYKFFILNEKNAVVWISAAITRIGEDVKLEGIEVEVKKDYKIGIVGNSTTAYQGRQKVGSSVGYYPVSYGSINVGSSLAGESIFINYSLPLMLKVLSNDNKSFILYDGDYKKWNEGQWESISSTSPSYIQFIEQGIDNLSPLLDRKITVLEPIPMTDKSEILDVGETGKVFSKTLDLKKYFDIRSIRKERE